MTAEKSKNIPYPAGTEISFDGAVNFRELGGYRTQDGRMVRYIAEAAIDAIEERYGNYERYFEAEFGLDSMRLMALREKYLI